jgi:hypothetical protein
VVCYIFDLVEIDHLGIAAQCWHAVSGQVPGGDTLSQILLLRFQEGRLKPVEHFDELFLLFLVQDAYPVLLMLMDDRAKLSAICLPRSVGSTQIMRRSDGCGCLLAYPRFSSESSKLVTLARLMINGRQFIRRYRRLRVCQDAEDQPRGRAELKRDEQTGNAFFQQIGSEDQVHGAFCRLHWRPGSDSRSRGLWAKYS